MILALRGGGGGGGWIFLLEKTIAAQLLNKFRTFYETALMYLQHFSKIKGNK